MLYYKWHVGLTDKDVSIYALPKDATGPAVGQWVSVIATYDGESGKLLLYVDGELISERTAPGAIRLDEESLTRPLAIGSELNEADFKKGNGPFNGYFSEVRLYNRALGADEVAALFADLSAAEK